MSEPKFTKGPWKVTEDGLVDKIVVGGDYDLIIDIVHKDGKRNDADSNLIAAAPEMYHWQGITIEVLRQICRSIETPDIIRVQLESLISLATPIQKKARGEE